MRIMLWGLLSLTLTFGNAQERVQHQTALLETIAQGEYKAYNGYKEADGTYIGGTNNLTYTLLRTQYYRLQPGVHQEVYMYRGEDPNRMDEAKELMFLPDNEAFPISYVEKVFEGNKKMQDAIGYAPRINPFKDGNRLVFLNGRIYLLTSYNDKDHWELDYVLEHKGDTPEKPEKKKGSFFKRLKAAKAGKSDDPSADKLQKLQPHKEIQTYLDAAYAKQQTVYAEWIKKPENKALADHTQMKLDLINKAIRKQRTDWMNSAEYKRIKARNQMAADHKKATMLTINNTSSNAIYIYEEGSLNGSRVNAHGSRSFPCDRNLFYTYASGQSSKQGQQISSANAQCGNTVSVQ